MRMRVAIGVMLRLAILFASGVVSAHHSFAGEFDNLAVMTVQGTVARVEMVNPHSFIYLDVTTNGGIERWALEGPGPNQVTRRGVPLDFVKPGDPLGACGYLARRDVAGTRTDAVSGRIARKLDAAVLLMPNGEKQVWSNYRQGKCGLDK